MTPELKAAWLTDLRSGAYPKTTDHLKDARGYCCLGVLCETAKIGFEVDAKAGPDGWFNPNCGDEGREVNDGNALSDHGRELFGLSDEAHDHLIDLNDKSDSFEPVIAYIEQNL